jgi:hypothetical protein
MGVTGQTLPASLVARLNQLGFALVSGDMPYTFLRLGPAGVFRVRVVSTGREWNVELTADGANQIGRLPQPTMPDGTKVLLSTAQLVRELPRLLEASLPSWDAAPSHDG